MDIENVATLARLNLTDEEKQNFKQQMDKILSYFSELDEVDTKGVVPLVTPVDIAQYMRADESSPWGKTEKALENAPQAKGNLFQVPPVV